MHRSQFLDLRVLTSLNELEGLEKEWNRVLGETAAAENVFLSWEWVFEWTKHYAADSELFLILWIQGEGEIVGIAPYYIRTVSCGLGVTIREMRTLGSEEVSACYLDVIVKEKEKAAFAKRIYSHLYSEAKHKWDVLVLPDVPAESGTIDQWRSLAEEAGRVWEIASVDACPIIKLPGTLDAFLAGLSKNERYNLKRKQKALAAAGHVEYVRFTAQKDIVKQLEAFIHLHEMRWGSNEVQGLFSRARYKSFHDAICSRLSEKGQVSLDFLILDGKTIAGIYGYVYKRTYWFYLPGFNPSMVPKASPGILLLFHRIQEAIEEGCMKVDLLRGVTPYKMAWANGLRRQITLRTYNRTPRAFLCKLISSGKDIAKVLIR